MPDWKDTVNLPRTDFPMKANLSATEPTVIARWESEKLYERIQERRLPEHVHEVVVLRAAGLPQARDECAQHALPFRGEVAALLQDPSQVVVGERRVFEGDALTAEVGLPLLDAEALAGGGADATAT